jgi:hypothetical protein
MADAFWPTPDLSPAFSGAGILARQAETQLDDVALPLQQQREDTLEPGLHAWQPSFAAASAPASSAASFS